MSPDQPKPNPDSPVVKSDEPVTTVSTSSSSSTSTSPGGREGGRPLAVYGVLVLGVATLLILLGIIYFSSGDRDKPEQPICINVTVEDVESAIYDGRVERLTVNYDETGDPTSGERYGPVVSRIDYVDGQCAYLPQGVQAENQVYQVLGVIQFYNDTTENSRVEVRKEHSEVLADSLYWTPTAIPTETPIATETPVATETPAVTETPEPTREPVVASPPVIASPETDASPEGVASPAA